MASVAVVVPWRPGDPHRHAAWDWLRPRYRWPVVEGWCDGEWCKAAAVADALDRTDAEVLVVADADVWTDGVGQALEAVAEGWEWAVPHGDVHRLDRDATEAVVAGGPFGGGLDEKPYPGHPGGGVVVLPRSIYEQCPLDPRFIGWGGEDDSWGTALRTMFGRPWRGEAPLWHLWHPPQPRMNRFVGSRESHNLAHRYRRAAHDPAAMRFLLSEVTRGRSRVRQ
jgi:hypothetical protein